MLDGAVYPQGPWQPETPILVHYVAEIARSIADGLAERRWTVAEASRELGIARQTLHDILSGRTVPDLLSVVRAEQALGRSVWPVRRSGRRDAGGAQRSGG